MLCNSTSIYIWFQQPAYAITINILGSRIYRRRVNIRNLLSNGIKKRQTTSLSIFKCCILIWYYFLRYLYRSKGLMILSVGINSKTVTWSITITMLYFIIIINFSMLTTKLYSLKIGYIVYNFAIFSLHKYNMDW